MALTGYDKYGNVFGINRKVEFLSVDSVDSPRNSRGQLVLQQNPHTRLFGRLVDKRITPGKSAIFDILHADGNWISRYPSIGTYRAKARNEAIARADGKLRKGSTSLGVSLATWQQSSSMVKGRFGSAAKFFGKFLHVLEHAPARKRFLRKPNPTVGDVAKHLRRADPKLGKRLADDLLEYEFGWAPLFEDITGAIKACTTAYPPEFVHAKALREVPDLDYVYQNTPPWGAMRMWRFQGVQVRCSVGYQVRVTNPNLWLANYLGLLNLPGIAWDLVPWSFVVNMFSNAGSLVNSLSNHVGLDVSGYSTTEKIEGFTTSIMTDYYFQTTQVQKFIESRKVRTVNVPPTRSFIFKMPKADMELGLIASALIGQQFYKIKKHMGH